MADALLIKTLVVILASVSTISLVARARLPAAVGYLLAGLVIGPHGLQLIATSDETTFLAELGIIFLMFMVGHEFSLGAMIDGRRDVFGAGSLQVGFTVLMVAGAAMLWGAGLPAAALLGGAVAMSSTAMIICSCCSRNLTGLQNLAVRKNLLRRYPSGGSPRSSRW